MKNNHLTHPVPSGPTARESTTPIRTSNGFWEVYDPQEDIYHMYGSKAEAIAAQNRKS